MSHTPGEIMSHSRPPMLADIFRQTETLDLVQRRRVEIEDFAERNLRPGRDGALHMFGSGDGWFAARAALVDTLSGRAHSGLDFTLNIAPRLGASDRAIAISMSGNVDRTVEGAEAALARGASLSVLTNGTGGRLKELGATVHSLEIPDIAKFLCGTSTYTATLATLQIALGQIDDNQQFASSLALLYPELPVFVEQADQFAQLVAVENPGCTGVRFLGVGASVATADYGAAKFVEVTKIPSWSDDLEEFAHRQYWSLQRSEIVCFLPNSGASARYADASAEALRDLDISTMAFELPGAQVPSARYRFSAPGDRMTVGLCQAIGLQLLAYHMGIATGTDPNKREHLKNDEAKFAVSRKLTRRSLLGTGQ